MKAILEFDLTDPDETLTYKRLTQAEDVYRFLWDWELQLRQWYKSDMSKIDIEVVRETYFDLKHTHHITTDIY